MRRSDLPYVFVRLMCGNLPALGLARREQGGRMHALVWAVSFEDPLYREVLLAWLERNRARWPIWGAIASARGHAALSRRLDEEVEEVAMTGSPVMIQTYRAAAYLGWHESELLDFRHRTDCSDLFEEEPDPLLADRRMTFVDLGGLVRRMIEDAVASAEEKGS